MSDMFRILKKKKKLVSLGVLDDLGYSYSSKGGFMKISKGALMEMNGHKVSKLYKLMG